MQLHVCIFFPNSSIEIFVMGGLLGKMCGLLPHVHLNTWPPDSLFKADKAMLESETTFEIQMDAVYSWGNYRCIQERICHLQDNIYLYDPPGLDK